MTKPSDKMKKDTRTKPAHEDQPTRNTPPKNTEKTGWQANIKQNTNNPGYQQDR